MGLFDFVGGVVRGVGRAASGLVKGVGRVADDALDVVEAVAKAGTVIPGVNVVAGPIAAGAGLLDDLIESVDDRVDRIKSTAEAAKTNPPVIVVQPSTPIQQTQKQEEGEMQFPKIDKKQVSMLAAAAAATGLIVYLITKRK